MNHPNTAVDHEAGEECAMVVRIKLRRAECSAVVTDMRTADKMLARWAAHDGAQRTISFELSFENGSSLCGSYEGKTGKAGTLSLSRFVRQALKDQQERGTACADELRLPMILAYDPGREVAAAL